MAAAMVGAIGGIVSGLGSLFGGGGSSTSPQQLLQEEQQAFNQAQELEEQAKIVDIKGNEGLDVIKLPVNA